MVGLGSNRWHGRHGCPAAVLRAAAAELAAGGVAAARLSPIVRTRPLGPSRRDFANAALIGLWRGEAAALLHLLQRLERDFGRRPGQRWGARVLDLDLLLFGQAVARGRALQLPHPRLHDRDFVLQPMLALWPNWRHPVLRLTVRQMLARRARARPVDCREPKP